ncbi:hypothetical protein ACFO0S_05570 [Chryseomicrobium palamuruense]|uniref:Sigma-X negative effector n=1 Tax=Chryseomicrobium palamuruense TaxID=682973 RepID=A0ABV8UTE4_9BACL
MTKKKYTDHDIEQLLHQMPPLSDQRSKEEMLKKLKQQTEPPRKKSKPWLPAVISVSALFVLVLFVQSMMGTITHDEAATESMAVDEGTADQAMSEAEDSAESAAQETEQADMSIMGKGESSLHSRILLSSDPLLDTHTLLPFAMDYNAYAIPISLLIPNERIEQDFGTLSVSNLDLYKTYASLVDEEGLGFSETHPLLGEYEATEEGLQITLPDDHPYDMASATMGVYMNTLKDVFGTEFDQAYLLNEAGEPLDWDQVGPLVEPVDLSQGNYAFNISQNALGESYLVPYSRTSYPNFEAALHELTAPEYNVVDPAIPQNVEFTVEETDTQVVVTFAETLNSESLTGYSLQLFIESMLATAAQMDKQLILENWDETIYSLPNESDSIVGINPIILATE